jgi:hypothetical protein
MSRRNTTLALTNTAVQRWRTLRMVDLINAAGDVQNNALSGVGGGAGASELIGYLGKASNGVAALGFDLTTADALDAQFYDMYDVDLTQKIYFDLLYSGIALEAGEVWAAAGAYLKLDLAAATANQIDYASLAAMSPASVSTTTVAADVGNLRALTGLYIPASSLTDNENPLNVRFTFTLTGQAAAECVLYAIRMKFTARAGY